MFIATREASVKIFHEAPGADLNWKVTAPLIVETPSGDSIAIRHWSLAGLEWPEDAEGHELFWNKLADAFARDSRHCRPFD